MTGGTGMLVGILAALALVVALQAWTARAARRNVGKPAPTVGPALDASRPALVYFFSPTCGPCRQLAPTIDALAASGAQVHKVDVSLARDAAFAWGVMATPTTVAVREGRIVDVIVGIAPRARFEGLLA